MQIMPHDLQQRATSRDFGYRVDSTDLDGRPPTYLADLKGLAPNQALAIKWGVSAETVQQHRRQLANAEGAPHD